MHYVNPDFSDFAEKKKPPEGGLNSDFSDFA
jgi:hypothetical protein